MSTRREPSLASRRFLLDVRPFGVFALLLLLSPSKQPLAVELFGPSTVGYRFSTEVYTYPQDVGMATADFNGDGAADQRSELGATEMATDGDSDGVPRLCDNCPDIPTAYQADADAGGIDDASEKETVAAARPTVRGGGAASQLGRDGDAIGSRPGPPGAAMTRLSPFRTGESGASTEALEGGNAR